MIELQPTPEGDPDGGPAYDGPGHGDLLRGRA